MFYFSMSQDLKADRGPIRVKVLLSFNVSSFKKYLFDFVIGLPFLLVSKIQGKNVALSNGIICLNRELVTY